MLRMCNVYSRKYLYCPHRRELEIPGGCGVLKDQKIKEMYGV